MASSHPVDHQGRILPDCSWPPDRAAPGSLELLRRFCNTTNLESGADRLDSASSFAEWLGAQGHDDFMASTADLARCVEVRESVRDACTAHRVGNDGTAAMAAIARLVDGIDFRIDNACTAFGLVVNPEHNSVDRFVGGLTLAVLAARSVGTWDRLKTCRTCRWVVYDSSKNRSGQWCSMSACGGRSKVRAHRARQHDLSDRAG